MLIYFSFIVVSCFVSVFLIFFCFTNSFYFEVLSCYTRWDKALRERFVSKILPLPFLEAKLKTVFRKLSFYLERNFYSLR